MPDPESHPTFDATAKVQGVELTGYRSVPEDEDRIIPHQVAGRAWMEVGVGTGPDGSQLAHLVDPTGEQPDQLVRRDHLDAGKTARAEVIDQTGPNGLRNLGGRALEVSGAPKPKSVRVTIVNPDGGRPTYRRYSS